MKRRWTARPAPRRARWSWAALATAIVITALSATFWWSLGGSGGRPRLVLDRDVIDLGDLPFDTPARAVFTLTNAGDGRLELADDLRVKVVKGC